MSIVKISELPELIALSDADAIPVVHAGVTKRISGVRIQDYLLGNLTVANITLGTSVTGGNIQISANLVPVTTDTITLGSPTKKFQSVYVGPGSVYITDKVLGTNAELTVSNGVLQINGANQLQVGQLKFVDNTIESTLGATDIQIGLTVSTANLVLNRNVTIASGKTITGAVGNFTNINTANVAVTGTFILSKGITHNATKPTLTANVVPINFETDDLIHVHTTGPGTTLTANLINLSTTVGKTVEVLVMSSAGGSTQFNHGVASSQSTNASSFFLTSRQTMYVKYFNIDGTTGNLFVTAIGNNTI